ncbi:MAG: pilus assembly protein N-terminal domain-containing protein [Pseudomonadota bacterium]
MKPWLVILSLFAPSVASAGDVIHLSPGRQQVVAAPDLRRAAIGNPRVADIRAVPESGQVIVTGVAIGSTDLILWSKSGQKRSYLIRVTGMGQSLLDEVRRLLAGIEGVVVRANGGRVVIDGQLYRSKDLERVGKVVALHPGVVNLTVVHPRALEYFAREIAAALAAAGVTGVAVHPAGDTLFLEGEAARPTDADRAFRIARSIFSKISNHLTVGLEPDRLLFVDVKMMEVHRSSALKAGLRLPGQIDAAGTFTLQGRAPSSSVTIGEGATASLLGLIEKGFARILANPKLLCRSGSPASFMAGGEVPIPLVSERTANVIFKPYGIQLQVKATVDRSRHVSMEIESKISDVDYSKAVQGFPAFLEHNVKTSADLNLGETVVLGGLIENRSSKNVSKIPFFGHIPILGELFKSRQFQNNESEFLVFLTPHPGAAEATEPKNAIRRAHAADQKAAEEIEFSILD